MVERDLLWFKKIPGYYCAQTGVALIEVPVKNIEEISVTKDERRVIVQHKNGRIVVHVEKP